MSKRKPCSCVRCVAIRHQNLFARDFFRMMGRKRSDETRLKLFKDLVTYCENQVVVWIDWPVVRPVVVQKGHPLEILNGKFMVITEDGFKVV